MSLKPMPGWLSGSYTLASLNAAAQRSVNLYSEVTEVAGEKVAGLLKGCPGLAAALLTLPTVPLRGLLAGGSPLTPLDGSGGRLFAVSGSKLYEVTAAGTITGLGGAGDHTARGDVGNDGRPVQMFPNGNQLFVVSAGQAYCDNGAGPVLVVPMQISGFVDVALVPAAGTCSTFGTSAFSNLGTPFFPALINGLIITINSVNYTATYVSPSQVNLSASAGVQTGVPWSTAGPGTSVIWRSGQPFLSSAGAGSISAGNAISINGVNYQVAVVTDATHLSITSDAGAQTNHAFVVPAFNGLVSVAGFNVNWLAGDKFPLSGMTTILINGTSYAVTSILSRTSLTIGTGLAPLITAVYGASPVLAAVQGAFLDSFFVITPPNSKQMNASAPLDGTTWDAADVATKESYPDNIGALYADHEELYVMGESRSEVWRAPGLDANFPFQRDPGGCMSEGIAAPASMCGFIDGVAWIGSGLRGQPVAYYAKGYIPERVSTHAIEQVWASFAQVSDAEAFGYEMDGHEFWQITFPSADQTWVYDRTASVQFGKSMWHERNSWDGAAFHRHRARCHAYVFGRHWVGDFATTGPSAGMIYEMDSDIYTDAGQMITCIRTLPHLCEQRLRQFFTKFQLDLETAMGFVPPSTPGVPLTVVLEWSDDGGHVFVGGGSAFTWTTSTIKTMERVVFWRLGSADDRIFRITVTGNARKALLAGYLDVIQGIS